MISLKEGFPKREVGLSTPVHGSQPIMVERAMYWNSRGAGTDTIGGYSN